MNFLDLSIDKSKIYDIIIIEKYHTSSCVLLRLSNFI